MRSNGFSVGRRILPTVLGLAATFALVTFTFVRQAGGESPAGRVSITADTVTDNVTGLVWQRAFSPTSLTFSQATAYCAALTLDGKSWRAPSMKELQTIVDDGTSDPAIDLKAFPGAPSWAFWTGTPLAGNAANGWTVHFRNGVADPYLVDTELRVRCVR